jgi:hypothetical protein
MVEGYSDQLHVILDGDGIGNPFADYPVAVNPDPNLPGHTSTPKKLYSKSAHTLKLW